MGSLTNYGEAALVKHMFNEEAYSPVASLYLALCTSSPGEAATGASMNECANSGNYARTVIAFGPAALRRVTQDGSVTFPLASGPWGTVSYWAIVDSGTHGAGNVLAYGAFAVAKSIVSGNTPTVSSEEIWVELTASTGLTTEAAEGFLDRMFRNQAFTIGATYIGLVTAIMDDDSVLGNITEVSGNGYERKLVNAAGGASPAWEAVANSATQNEHAIVFPTPSGSWGTVVGSFMTNVASGTSGIMLWYDNGITDQAVGAGDVVQYAAGALDFSQD